jgi:hypothetical protein
VPKLLLEVRCVNLKPKAPIGHGFFALLCTAAAASSLGRRLGVLRFFVEVF